MAQLLAADADQLEFTVDPNLHIGLMGAGGGAVPAAADENALVSVRVHRPTAADL